MKLFKILTTTVFFSFLSLALISCNNSNDDILEPEYPSPPQINLNTKFMRSFGIETTGIQKIYEHNGILFAPTIAKGVFTSTDNGINWTASNIGIVNNNNEQLTVIETYDISGYNNSLYLITEDNIFLSKDLGNNWEPTTFNTEGFPFGGYRVCAINESTVCASSGSGKFIYNRSSDYGTTWTFESQSFGDYLFNYKVYNGSLYATKNGQGIVNSTDDGISWNSDGLETTNCYDYLIKDNLFIACTDNGIYRTDSSGNWIEANNSGLQNDSAERIKSLVESDNWLFALTSDNEIYVSKIINNEITDWQKLELEGLDFIDDYMYISAININNGKLLIGTTDLHEVGRPSPTHGKGIYNANFNF